MSVERMYNGIQGSSTVHAETDNVGSNCTAVRQSIDVRLQPVHNHAVSPTTSSANNLSRWPMSTSSTQTDLVSNPGLRKDRPATNRLSHCTAVIIRDGLVLKHGYKTRAMFHLKMR